MKDIKFRAYCDEIHSWVYGGLIHITEEYLDNGDVIEINKYFIVNELGVQFEIDNVGTIGQYTGLKDKNGIEIYEGDIIEYSYDAFTGNFDTKIGKGIIIFDNGAFWIKPFEIENIKVDMENEEWFLLYAVNEDTLEVIGNIYDNPELLKEGE